VIWEPFVLALVLGIIVSAGLYFAYLWPAVEPLDDEAVAAGSAAPGAPTAPPPAASDAPSPSPALADDDAPASPPAATADNASSAP
jgi:hypothetical protein